MMMQWLVQCMTSMVFPHTLCVAVDRNSSIVVVHSCIVSLYSCALKTMCVM